jgi:hypothetical protein
MYGGTLRSLFFQQGFLCKILCYWICIIVDGVVAFAGRQVGSGLVSTFFPDSPLLSGRILPAHFGLIISRISPPPPWVAGLFPLLKLIE